MIGQKDTAKYLWKRGERGEGFTGFMDPGWGRKERESGKDGVEYVYVFYV